MATVTLSKKLSFSSSDSMTRLKVWVSETSDNIPSEIFLYTVLPVTPDLEYVHKYARVCKYGHMLSYPTSSEDEDTAVSHVRKASIDMLFESADEAESFFTSLQTEVLALLNDICSTKYATDQVLAMTTG